MDEIESDIDNLDIVTPLITFEKRMTLDMGDATIILEFVGGHSPGTILTYVVEDKAIFTGDNVEAQFPYFGQARFMAWKETLRKILSMDIDVVVPGHGPVGGMEMVEKYASFFEKLEEEVRDFDSRGLTVEEMAEKSDTIIFFPEEEISREDLPQSWRGEQYRAAARAILAEKE
jgi:cyclase